jgi:hypothetical protein
MVILDGRCVGFALCGHEFPFLPVISVFCVANGDLCGRVASFLVNAAYNFDTMCCAVPARDRGYDFDVHSKKVCLLSRLTVLVLFPA